MFVARCSSMLVQCQLHLIVLGSELTVRLKTIILELQHRSVVHKEHLQAKRVSKGIALAVAYRIYYTYVALPFPIGSLGLAKAFENYEARLAALVIRRPLELRRGELES
jgi:hypothetical protein